MIVFDLHCTEGHRFEGWFGSSSDYEDQKARGLVSCPECGSGEVGKAPMAPAVPAKGNTEVETRGQNAAGKTHSPVAARKEGAGAGEVLVPSYAGQPVSNKPIPAEIQEALKALAKAQEKALKESTWVGSSFAEKSREMHYGEREEAPIHGQATAQEARSLMEEGVAIAPLPFPVAPPEDLN
jgi:hypothetical protein